jgi:hypothetical protein
MDVSQIGKRAWSYAGVVQDAGWCGTPDCPASSTWIGGEGATRAANSFHPGIRGPGWLIAADQMGVAGPIDASLVEQQRHLT